MRFRSTSLLSTLALVSLLGAAPALAEWHFAIPPGWTDLSPGKPVPAEIPHQVAAVAQGGQFHTYAMDLRKPRGNFVVNFNAIVQPVAMVANQQVLKELEPLIYTQVANELPGAKAHILESAVTTVAGQPAIRFVIDVKTDDLTMRTLKYALPGGDQSAFLTYAATPETFDKVLPVFEASVQQTQGITAPPLGRRIGARIREWGGDSVSAEDWQKIFGAVGKFVGLIVAIVLVRYFTRKPKKGMA